MRLYPSQAEHGAGGAAGGPLRLDQQGRSRGALLGVTRRPAEAGPDVDVDVVRFGRSAFERQSSADGPPLPRQPAGT
jgi:hypothetical protein